MTLICSVLLGGTRFSCVVDNLPPLWTNMRHPHCLLPPTIALSTSRCCLAKLCVVFLLLLFPVVGSTAMKDWEMRQGRLTGRAGEGRPPQHGDRYGVSQSITKYLPKETDDYLRACCKQVLFLTASVCASVSVRTKFRKLLVRNWCNLVEICPMVNARSALKLMTFDLDLWLWELFSYVFNSDYIFWMAWPSNFIFSLKTHFQNI